ncbi:uncharacterized protein N7459_005486 [Penicillium hispanicum]|uniref:uncharacterized protein n=1 Tax=Penicillium hispanicum TaxID=1080232 RepID=UPI0025422BEF|nr:uncharacterized protein N7459_005486 [Penicillium hispanicum]KAJ5579501.1 hypothetical protein N7459_005486 [Penicillium hispanicum]
MTTQRAIIVQEPGQAILAYDIPIPQLPDEYILVKAKSVALNTTDWRHIDYLPCGGAILGCDYAGTVETKGDRVADFVHGCDAVRPGGGAFAEYVIAKGDLQIHIPDSMNSDAAATLSVGLTTVGQNLYQILPLPFPATSEATSSDDSILIYGGATATGSLAIQLAKMSGLRVVTTCSDANRSFMYELGADAVFDYHDAKVGQQIRDDTEDALELVLDTISSPQSVATCSAALSSSGGSYNALLDVQCAREDVDSHVSMAYDILGEPYQIGTKTYSPGMQDPEFGIRWWNCAQTWLQNRRLVPHPHQLKPGGLIGVLNGLQMMRKGKVRARKPVYRVDNV